MNHDYHNIFEKSKDNCFIWCPHPSSAYRLLDSGQGLKLEESGGFRFIRPEPQAMWEKSLPESLWHDHHAVFKPGSGEEGGWLTDYPELLHGWQVEMAGIRLQPRLTNFRHLGFFPEQSALFEYMAWFQPQNALNLFAYSGMASLYLARMGCSVTHIDASPKANQYAKENAALNNISTVRIITEDAGKFVDRAARRGDLYDMIVLDPPKFGRGPKGEIWDIELNLAEFLRKLPTILMEKSMVIMTLYAIRVPPHALMNAMNANLPGGQCYCGALGHQEQNQRGFTLPQSWSVIWLRGY